ncbi:hypothetical protein SWZG_00012 [Synechococcus phage S-SKS1]|uniref:Uncharacterized protein n=1 Tax=Synechococcus phage S-SKS1 TaxID=754042 RepID=M4QPI0_9CAUD|nr:tail fiber protein [Synechococcus phage S-SKS1]AGH31525.1 hypothetical protein SWZG_00012 [Synechococcus phage S-SKS1]
MATPIRIRRSPVPAKVPTNSDLLFAELGLNTFDGRVFLKQDQGKLGISTRVIEVGAGSVLGKTIFVTATGNDENSGLNEIDSKATIKGAAAISLPGDTIKVYPGIYVEDNPIILDRSVSLEGTELRNCIVTPKNVDRDLFYVNNSVHVTDMSFRLDDGRDMTDGAAVLSFEPLVGVTSDRFFDAARMIRYNLDYIANETVGYLTSTDYKNPAISIDSTNCADDIKDVYRAICHDITRGGNSKCIDAGKKYFDINGNLDHIVGFGSTTIDAFNYSIGIARSCVNNILWTGNYQSEFSQLRDLSIQADGATGSNSDYGSCANVHSAIFTCVGIVTNIIQNGIDGNPSTTGLTTNYPGNAGVGFTGTIGVTSALYNERTGNLYLEAPGISVVKGDRFEIRDLIFSCDSGAGIGTTTQFFPSGKYGNEFYVDRVNADESFVVNVGTSTLPHTYVSGGFIVDRSVAITTASYDNVSGIITFTSPGAKLKVNEFITLRDLIFSCDSGAGIGTTTQEFPSGKNGYDFKVLTGAGNTFSVNVGTSTLPHTYVSDGIVRPPYSPGVGPITQGPYVRNCTNFIPKSIGMRINGFDAEPADQEDIGVTGSMSVDSFTQFNQGGIGVSITNGAYAQLVSIFTICDQIAIYTNDGGQCDLTNSNASFGTFGLYSEGVGDETSKSIYRYTGIANTESLIENDVLVVSGLGQQRPYDGQALYFGELFYFVKGLKVTNPGSGYTKPPRLTIDSPSGPQGATAEGSSNIDSSGQVTSIDIIADGSQYRLTDNTQVVIDGPTGAGTTATAEVELFPIYYSIESATKPSAGISTIILNQRLNNTIGAGTTIFFSRVSLQITSSHSFEWVGSGNTINPAKPALGGVVIPENEVIEVGGGQVVYTSTDQAGNFRIGDGLVANQLTGTISGRSFDQSIINKVNPLIIALG